MKKSLWQLIKNPLDTVPLIQETEYGVGVGAPSQEQVCTTVLQATLPRSVDRGVPGDAAAAAACPSQ